MAVASTPKDYSPRAIEELLECAICRSRLRDPRVLTCQHYYCKRCLKASVGTASKSLKCALCRKVTKLSFEGVDALPPNYAVKGLLSIAHQRKPKGTEVANSSSKLDGNSKTDANDNEAHNCGDSKGVAEDGRTTKVPRSKNTAISKGSNVARIVAKSMAADGKNRGRQVALNKKKNKLVFVPVCSSTDASTSSDSSCSDSELSQFTSTSDSSETTTSDDSSSSEDDSSDDSLSSLSDSELSDSECDSDDSTYDAIPSASLAFGDMSIGTEVYVFSKVRKPIKGRLAHIKGYRQQLLAGVELNSGDKSWIKKECNAARGTSLHQWWTQRTSARAIVHLDDCLASAVVDAMKEECLK